MPSRTFKEISAREALIHAATRPFVQIRQETGERTDIYFADSSVLRLIDSSVERPVFHISYAR